jgi:cyclopropane-fatty-acyl-phospholipid synthase
MAITDLATDIAVRSQLKLVQDLAQRAEPAPWAVRFWEGSTWEVAPDQPALFTLVLNHPGALRKMLWPPSDLRVAEAYIYDDCNIEGDLPAFIRLFRGVAASFRSVSERIRMGWRLFNLPAADWPRMGRPRASVSGKLHSKERDAQAISYHYDVPSEFFELFLGSQMQYTCAVFADPDEDLETAQERKLHYLCRKLRLKAGERLLDIGCGWGCLVMFAARHYGVQAVGATLSKRQAEWAQRHIREEGLQDRCRVDHLDYRDVAENQIFDKVATVCVLEHLGEPGITTYMQKVHHLLRPGGSAVIQQITLSRPFRLMAHRRFSERYVFPDGELVPISTTLREAEKAGLEVRDVESLREHYPLTIKHWLRKLDATHNEAVHLTDEATVRVHKLYLTGAMVGYCDNVYNLHHTVLVKPDRGTSGFPLERKDWYLSSSRQHGKPQAVGA